MLNSVSQVALKWLVQQNITVVTAADNPVYIQQDLDLYAPRAGVRAAEGWRRYTTTVHYATRLHSLNPHTDP